MPLRPILTTEADFWISGPDGGGDRSDAVVPVLFYYIRNFSRISNTKK
jgi:hypothetical protein